MVIMCVCCVCELLFVCTVRLLHGVLFQLLPVPAPVRTNKFGIADFGHLTVQGARGVYDIQPKAFVGRNTVSGMLFMYAGSISLLLPRLPSCPVSAIQMGGATLAV